MTLKELKNMIAEEFAVYQNEADDVDVSVSDADVDVDAEMGGEEEAAGEEDVLRSIYDLLAAHFEGGGELPADDMGDDMGDDIEDVEEMSLGGEEEGEEEEELDENATTSPQYQKTGMASGGSKSTKDSGYVKPGGKGSTGYDASSKALQERFQKLANIIK
mgnify:CR=1 FL=1